jgi:hypothetical protein
MIPESFTTRRWIPHKPNTDVLAFGVMVDNGVEDSGDGSPRLVTRATQTLGERPIYINGPGNCASGQDGICYIPDGTPCQVAYDTGDGTPALGESWGPVAGSFKIRKGFPGFKIFQAEAADGIATAAFEPGPPGYWGTLDGALASGNSATASIYKFASGNYSDSTLNETVYAPPVLASGNIALGKIIRAVWSPVSRRLEVVSAEC